MGFRDDQLAGRERIDALEKEVARLRAENEALEASASQPKPRGPKVGKVVAPVGGVALLAVIGAVVAPLPPVGRMVLLSMAVIAVAFAVLVSMLSRHLLVVEPGELLVLSGRPHVGPDGQTRGYRIVRGRRTMRLPIIERADWMKLGPFPFAVVVERAYAHGNDVIRVHASASVELSSDPYVLPNAVERFLGRSSEEICEVTRQVVEGALRSVIAELSFEELQQRNALVIERLLAGLEPDLDALGLSLTSLVIDDLAKV